MPFRSHPTVPSGPDETQALVDQACRCRRLAGATYNRETAGALERMAEEFDRAAAELRAGRLR
jgi:hypothetical protein